MAIGKVNNYFNVNMKKEHLDILNSHEPGTIVIDALECLIERDRDLLEIDANEKSITHRLALIRSLQELYNGNQKTF